MRQLYEKSGSAARISDFAIDIRKIVKADSLPEYALSISRNGEGEEIVDMVRRSVLDVTDSRYELPRSPRRRVGQGIREPSTVFQAQDAPRRKGRKRGA